MIVSLLLLMAAMFLAVDRYVPSRYNPFKPLSIDASPTFVTGLKIAALKFNTETCFDVLFNSDLEYTRLPEEKTGEGCGFYGAATLLRSGVSYGGNITLTCPALVSLAIWEKHGLQTRAKEVFSQQVVRVRHYGTYACRNINNARSGRRSQHALANAIDIAGFTLRDGTEISVLEDWGVKDRKGRFLKQLRDSACGYFATVLGPAYNAAHKDHFHFDQGGFQQCK